VASGTPAELMARGIHGQSITARIKGPQADVERKLAQLEGVGQVREMESGNDGYVRYQMACERGDDLPERVFRTVVDNKWVLTELRQDGATLEDVFAELTR